MSLFGGQLQLDFDISGSVTSTDSLLYLSHSNPADIIDIGWYGSYISSGLKYAGMFRDASDGTFKLFKDMTAAPTNNVVSAVSSFADLSVNTIIVNAGTASQYLALDSNKKIVSVASSAIISDAYIRGLFSESDVNLTYDNSTGVFGFASSPTFTNEILNGALQCKGLATIGYDFGVTGGVKISTAAYGKPTVESLTSALAVETLYLNPAGGEIQTGSGGLLSRGITAIAYESGVSAGIRITKNTYAKPAIESLTSGGVADNLYLNPTGGYVSIGTAATIGTTTANGSLTISKGVNSAVPTLGTTTGAIAIHGDATSYGLFAGVVNTGSSWIQAMRCDATATAYALLLNPSGGYVCLGNSGLTSSTAKVQITGNIEHAWDSVSHYVRYQPSPSSYYGGWDWDSSNRDLSLVAVGADGDPSIYFRTGSSATERMRINASGNVTIGIANPDRRLVIQGIGASRDPLLYLKQTNDYGYSFNVDSSSSGRLSIVGVNNGVETVAIQSLDRTTAAMGLGSAPTTTNGYPTRLDVYNSGISSGPCIKLQDAASSGRGHIQIGSSATASNNIHIGCEGDGSFYIWNGNWGAGTQKFQVGASGDFRSDNNSGYHIGSFYGVGGAYLKLINTNSGGYFTNLGHDTTHTYLNNAAAGNLYLQTFTANAAVLSGRMMLDQAGRLSFNSVTPNATITLLGTASAPLSGICMGGYGYDATPYHRLELSGAGSGYQYYMSQNIVWSAANNRFEFVVASGWGGLGSMLCFIGNGRAEFSTASNSAGLPSFKTNVRFENDGMCLFGYDTVMNNAKAIYFKSASGLYNNGSNGTSIFKYSDDCQYYDVVENQSHIFRTSAYGERLRINSTATTVTGNAVATGTFTSDGGYRNVPFACAAEVYNSGSATQALVLAGAKLTIFDSTGISKNATPSASSDNITITVAGTYQVVFRSGVLFTALSGGLGIIALAIQKNGSSVAASVQYVSNHETNSTVMAVSQCLVDCAVNDVLTIFGGSTPNQTITFSNPYLSVTRVGTA